MKKAFAVLAVLMLLCLGSVATADVFNLGYGLTNLETVRVGDPGNVGELSGAGAGTANSGPDRICGAVSYAYMIGKFEVTAQQYCDFLNSKARSDTYGLYNTKMADLSPYSGWGCNIQRNGSPGYYSYSVGSDWANRPVNYVSYWDACRFANWLNNGQGNGDTETGAYTLDGYVAEDGHSIQRNTGAKWFLPSEDEWYKAAYYRSGGTEAGYWDYPSQSDSVPSNLVTDSDPGNSANFYWNGYSIGEPYYRTNVGEFENSSSAYGTLDQGGNVWEWDEAVVYDAYAFRGLRGGSFYDNDYCGASNQRASERNDYAGYPSLEYADFGFRMASLVPEPSSLFTMGAGLGVLLGLRRRGTTG